MAAASHIADVMMALRTRLGALANVITGIPVRVEIGNPAQFHPHPIGAEHLVTVFLYSIEPDHTAWLATPERGIAVKLKIMINVYGGEPPGGAESPATVELRILSHIMRLFTEQPVLGPIKVKGTNPIGDMVDLVTRGISVEIQQTSLDMEEINHIWTTQGETPFRTALTYSLNYSVVTPLSPKDEGPPVLRVEVADRGGPVNADDMGVYPSMPAETEEPALNLGALAFLVGPAASAKLEPSMTVAAAVGDISAKLVLITESEADFDVAVEKLDASAGTWGAVAIATGGSLSSVARHTLTPAVQLPPGHSISFANPNAAAVFRISVKHQTEPETYKIGSISLVVSNGGGGGP